MKSLYIEHDIYIGTYDIDFAGHVSNIAYLRWLEDMRMKVFDTYYSFKELMDKGMIIVVAATEIKYKKPVRLFDKPKGKMWCSFIGNTSFVFDGEIYLEDVLVTQAKHTGVFVDMKTMRPIRVPKEFAQQVQGNRIELVTD